MALLRSAAAGADWFNSQYVTGNTELKYSYRFLCDEHYYGPACGDLCRPRNDQFGHLYCSPNGTKICLDGWQGEYCDRGKTVLLRSVRHFPVCFSCVSRVCMCLFVRI